MWRALRTGRAQRGRMRCEVEIESLPDGLCRVRGVCRRCKQVIEITAPEDRVIDFAVGAPIQTALGMLSPDEREFLVSMTCGPCYDAMWEELTA